MQLKQGETKSRRKTSNQNFKERAYSRYMWCTCLDELVQGLHQGPLFQLHIDWHVRLKARGNCTTKVESHCSLYEKDTLCFVSILILHLDPNSSTKAAVYTIEELLSASWSSKQFWIQVPNCANQLSVHSKTIVLFISFKDLIFLPYHQNWTHPKTRRSNDGVAEQKPPG